MGVAWVLYLFTFLLTNEIYTADQWEQPIEEELVAQQPAIFEEETDEEDDGDEGEAVFAPLPVLQRQQAGLWLEPGGIEAVAVEEEEVEEAELAAEEGQEEQPAPAVAEEEIVFGLVPHQAPADAMGENGNNGAAE